MHRLFTPLLKNWMGLIFLGLCWTACGQATNDQDRPAELLTVEDLEQLLAQTPDVQLVDVRTPEEFHAGHLEGAININYHSADFEQQLAKLDASRTTVLYCARGGRSHKTFLLAQKLKFKGLHDLAGGYNAWVAAQAAKR